MGHVAVGMELAAAALFLWSAWLHRRARRRLDSKLRELEDFRIKGRTRLDAALAAIPRECPGCGLAFEVRRPNARA